MSWQRMSEINSSFNHFLDSYIEYYSNLHLRIHMSKRNSETYNTSVHAHTHAESLQSCSTLCNGMECSPPGSSVHEILQARILEWIGLPFSSPGIFLTQGSNPCLLHLLHCRHILYPLSHLGSPYSEVGTLNTIQTIYLQSVFNTDQLCK